MGSQIVIPAKAGISRSQAPNPQEIPDQVRDAPCRCHNGQITGINNAEITPIDRFSGIPIFMKSLNAYPPGP